MTRSEAYTAQALKSLSVQHRELVLGPEKRNLTSDGCVGKKKKSTFIFYFNISFLALFVGLFCSYITLKIGTITSYEIQSGITFQDGPGLAR